MPRAESVHTVESLVCLELRRREILFNARPEASRDALQLAHLTCARGTPPRDATRPVAIARVRTDVQAYIAQRGDALRELEREGLGGGVEDRASLVVHDADAQTDDVQAGQRCRDVGLRSRLSKSRVT